MLEQKITFDKFIRWTAISLITVAVFAVTNYLSSVLLPFFIAWLFAYLMYPMVKFIQYRMHVKVRALAILIAMAVVLGVVGMMIYFIIPPMIGQFQKLYEVLMHWLHQTTHTNDLTTLVKNWIEENQEQVERFFKSNDFKDAIRTSMPKVFAVIGQTANIVLSIVASCITLLYMFFILLDYEFLTSNWIKIFPKKNRPFWHELAGDVERELHTRSVSGGAVHGCDVLHRIQHNGFPYGNRSGHTHRSNGSGALSAHLRHHSYRLSCHA